MAAKKGSNYLSQVDTALENAEEDRKRKLFNQRIEIARTGIAAYQSNQIRQALESYHTYLTLLEEAKGVGEGGLLPAHFDLKKDAAEIRMISGIFWDLTKLYDQAQSPAKQKDFHRFLEKFIAFTRGMPFQSSSAEAVKKFLRSRKVAHREELKATLEVLGGKQCFVATALVDVIHLNTLPSLRQFRDQILSQYFIGRLFIRAYYICGPWMARIIEKLPLIPRKLLGKGLDYLASGVQRLFF